MTLVNYLKKMITSDTISLLHQISSGSSIEINEEQAIKLRFLSILLGNDELHRKLNELFPTNCSEKNINTNLKNIEFLYMFSHVNETIDFSIVISFIASHFYMIDIKEFLKQSRQIQYMIISHDELQIESEDILFDIISQIIENKKDTDEISDILFLEEIEFVCLSETKFREFISVFDFNDMSGQLWQNLCQCFFPHQMKKCQRNSKYYHKKRERSMQNLIVCGCDKHNQLGVKPNNIIENFDPFISPPVKFSLDLSSLLSYSSFGNHSVLVTSDGSLKGIGSNLNGKISATLQKKEAEDFTDFCITDDSRNHLAAVSAVCYQYGTLYMFSKKQ